MTTFVILAAGRGTRVGRAGECLHKALIPLAGKAVLSHIFDLVPDGVRIVVCVGHRQNQVRDYVQLAHPQLNVTFVYVDGWDRPHGGPGASLLAARDVIGNDEFTVTSCDTLWERDLTLWWSPGYSWVGVAPIPPGTTLERWCRVQVNPVDHSVTEIFDKRPGGEHSRAYTGLAHIAHDDTRSFWEGLTRATPSGELQVSEGLNAVVNNLFVREIHWTDVGDEASYAAAIARLSGYDWIKYDQATYVLPTEGRVVKFNASEEAITHRVHRAAHLQNVVPTPIVSANDPTLLAHPYVPGVTAYQAIDRHDTTITEQILTWFDRTIAHTAVPEAVESSELLLEFYLRKTLERVDLLHEHLREPARDAVSRVDWDDLIAGAHWGTPHGDFNFGNIIVTPGGEFVGIDWRENFAGSFHGDLRYDLAKLLAGTVVHWQRAQWGDFRPWTEGVKHADLIRQYVINNSHMNSRDVEIIAALSLINSAPLHASPLDEVLVARGCAWLQQVV